MKTSRIRRFTALGVAALFGLTACTASSQEAGTTTDNATDGVTLGLTYIPNVQFSPVYVAKDQGLYAAAGAEVTVRHHGADEGLFTALVSGEEDIVLASGDEVLQARDAGMDLVSVATYYASHPVTFIVPTESDIASLADLKGRRIGVPGEYGSNWYALLAVLANEGLTRDDVEVVSIGYTQQAALAGGQVDVVVGFSNNDLVQIQASGQEVRALTPDPEQLPLVSASLVTTRTFAEEHPEALRSVIKGTTEGISAVIADPEAAITATQTLDPTLNGEAADTARVVLDATIALWKGSDGTVSMRQDESKWAQMAAFFLTVPDVLSSPADLGAAMSNDYVS